MTGTFDIRKPADRDRLIATFAATADQSYPVDQQELKSSLMALAAYVPASVPLIGRPGSFNIFSHHVELTTILMLGNWLRTLASKVRFNDVCNTLANSTQFWDTFFELRVAHFFLGLPVVEDLAFGEPYVVRGHTKRPEFTVETRHGPLVVECKRIHFNTSKLSEKFAANVYTINNLLAAEDFAASFRVELDFIAAEREHFPLLAQKVVATARDLAASGGGRVELDTLTLYVSPRSADLAIPLSRRGLQRNIVICSQAGKAIAVDDPMHIRLRAFSSRYATAYLRLVTAALLDARTQLPEHLPAIICIGDISAKVAEELVEPHLEKIELPANLQMVALWQGESARVFYPSRAATFVNNILGKPVSSTSSDAG